MWSDESKSISRKISWPKNARVMFSMPVPRLEHDSETRRNTKQQESINKGSKTLNFVLQKKGTKHKNCTKNTTTILKFKHVFRISGRAGFARAPAFKEFTCASVFFICFIIAMSCHNSTRHKDSHSGMSRALAWFKYGTAFQPETSEKTEQQKPGPCPLTRFL